MVRLVLTLFQTFIIRGRRPLVPALHMDGGSRVEVATTGHPLHSVVFERSGIGDIKALISAYASASGAAMGEVVDGFEPRMC